MSERLLQEALSESTLRVLLIALGACIAIGSPLAIWLLSQVKKGNLRADVKDDDGGDSLSYFDEGKEVVYPGDDVTGFMDQLEG